MNPGELANKYFGKIRHAKGGAEITPEYCPFCNGGNNKDKYTFAMNSETGLFNCARGTCGEKGNFNRLLKHYNIKMENENRLKSISEHRKFLKPQVRLNPPTKRIIDYIESRGISRETMEFANISSHEGNVAFPYYEKGELIFLKFRPPKEFTGDGRKAWRYNDSKPIFYLMDKCDPQKPLVIVEGEYDALALIESGVENVVSVPSGNKDLDCLDYCWDWISQFMTIETGIIIWADDDDAGKELAHKLANRIGIEYISMVESEYKDANDNLLAEGKAKTAERVKNAKPYAGNVVDITDFDLPTQEEELFLSTISGLNEHLDGFGMGELTVVTGINGGGKSTFLGQEILYAREQDYKACVYSGEHTRYTFKELTLTQASGEDNLESHITRAGNEKWTATAQSRQRFNELYKESIWLVDRTGGINMDELLETFRYSAKRYGCRIFVVDNLMTCNYSGSETDFYRKQSQVVGRLKDFAYEFSAHVFLVAHPRKTEGENIKKSDIAGTFDIANRADNIIAIRRLSKEEIDKNLEFGNPANSAIKILKSRRSGTDDVTIDLNFLVRSKRFWVAHDRTTQHNFLKTEKLLDVGF